MKLNLGCGDKLLPGYLNVDAAMSRKGVEPDVVTDIRELALFEDSTADEILAVHVVEHFYLWEVVPMLRRWAEVLRPGGTLILECPNLLSACKALLEDPSAAGPGREGQQAMWPLYGDPSWQDPLMTHRWGYTPESLAQVMRAAGFVDVKREPAQFKKREPRDMRITGRKP